MSNDFLNKISVLVPDQFPDFYATDGQNFISFVQAYMEFLELQSSPIGNLRSLLSYNDIDSTLDQYILHFKNKYLYNIQFNIASNPRLFLKHSLDFYRSKGSPRSIDLFFRLVYGLQAQTYYPGNDVFKLSDGVWVKPNYLEVTHTPNNVSYIGQEIAGALSGATAFIDRLVRRQVSGKFIDVFYIENILGTFQINEPLTYYGQNKQDAMPTIIGSLNSAVVFDGGQDYQLGNILGVTSVSGVDGVGIVSGISTQTGLVDFTLNDGGWGYTTNSTIIISDHVLGLANLTVNTLGRTSNFNLFEEVIQPLANISYGSLSGGNLIPGLIINEYSGTSLSGTGTILSVNATSNSTGSLLVSPSRFSNGSISNLNSNGIFHVSGNSISGNVLTYTDQTVTANIMGISSNSTFFVDTANGSFIPGEQIYQTISGNIVGRATITKANTSGIIGNISVDNISGIFFPSNQIEGSILVSGSLETATANLRSISTTLGVFNTLNSFSPFPGNYVYTPGSNTIANIISISNGNTASFGIGSINNQEVATLPTDLLVNKNTGNVTFYNLLLSGTNGNTGVSNAYGFPKFANGNPHTPLYQILGFEQVQIGSVAALNNINQGNNYTTAPFVLIYNRELASLDLDDYIIATSNSHLTFSTGETINQQLTISNSYSISVTGSNTFSLGELVYQSNGTANIATGIIQTLNISGNIGSMVINSVSGSFSNSYKIHGGFSNGQANIATLIPYQANASGIIKSQESANILYVKRISLESFDPTQGFLYGTLSGATANISLVIKDSSPKIDGLNANVSANVTSANGVISNISIIGSGLGFSNGTLGIFSNNNNIYPGTLKVQTGPLGISQGTYISNKGFLSDDIYLFDGDFYQEYSYQIISKLPFQYYADIIKKVLHPAGTRVFGKVELTSNTENIIDAVITPNVSEPNLTLSVNSVSNNASFIVGEQINQGNNATGTIISPIKSILTIPANTSGYLYFAGSGVVTIDQYEYLISNTGAVGTFGESTFGVSGTENFTIPNSLVGTIYQPNSSVNSASGNVTFNLISGNNQVLYVSDISGSFVPGETLQINVANSAINILVPNVNTAINTIEINQQSGRFVSNSTVNTAVTPLSNISLTILSITREIL